MCRPYAAYRTDPWKGPDRRIYIYTYLHMYVLTEAPGDKMKMGIVHGGEHGRVIPTLSNWGVGAKPK